MVQRRKAWLDRHTKKKHFFKGMLVLYYTMKPSPLKMSLKLAWIRSFDLHQVYENCTIELADLQGQDVLGIINGSKI